MRLLPLACLAVLPAATAGAAYERVDDWTLIDPATRAIVRSPVATAPEVSPARSLPSRAATASLSEGYTACFSTNDAWPFDLASLAVAPRVALSPEGNYPYDAAITLTGTEVWQASASGDHVVVLDRATDLVVERIPVGQYAVGIAFSWDGALAFVSSRDDMRIDVVDTSTYRVLRSLPMPQDPGKIAIDPVSHLVYVAEWYGPRVFELAADASSILRTATLGDSHWAIAVSPDGVHLYVTERDPALNLVRDIDRASLAEIRTLPVARDPWGLDVTADGTKLVVASEDAPAIAVIDVPTWTSISLPITVTDGPQDLDIDDASGRAFIAAGRAAGNGLVWVLDIATAALTQSFPVGGYKTSLMVVQPSLPLPPCPTTTLPPVARVKAVKRAGDVRLTWNVLAVGRDGYNAWSVSSKRELPIVTSPPVGSATSVCTRSAVPCDHVGGVAGPAGSTLFYQVKAVCGGIEGP